MQQTYNNAQLSNIISTQTIINTPQTQIQQNTTKLIKPKQNKQQPTIETQTSNHS